MLATISNEVMIEHLVKELHAQWRANRLPPDIGSDHNTLYGITRHAEYQTGIELFVGHAFDQIVKYMRNSLFFHDSITYREGHELIYGHKNNGRVFRIHGSQDKNTWAFLAWCAPDVISTSKPLEELETLKEQDGFVRIAGPIFDDWNQANSLAGYLFRR